MTKKLTATVMLILIVLQCFMFTAMAQENTVAASDAAQQTESRQSAPTRSDNQDTQMPGNSTNTPDTSNAFPQPHDVPSNGNQPQRGQGGRGGMGGQGGFGGGMQPPDMPMGGFQPQAQASEQTQTAATAVSESLSFTEFVKEYTTPIISMILLIFAFIFVIFYKRKSF